MDFRLTDQEERFREEIQTWLGDNLPDGWIGAGFVRRNICDHLHGFSQSTPLEYIDVLYFQPGDLSKASEQRIELRLRHAMPGPPWSAKNQARRHLRNFRKP